MIKLMTASEVVAKQEEYRERTILKVAELTEKGFSNAEISEEVGISFHEVNAIQKIVKRRLKKESPPYQKLYPIERRYF